MAGEIERPVFWHGQLLTAAGMNQLLDYIDAKVAEATAAAEQSKASAADAQEFSKRIRAISLDGVPSE